MILKDMENTQVFDLLNDPYIETPFNIIESYFKGQHLNRLVRHQLESYNNFVNYQIAKTIEMFNPVHIASEQDFDPVSKKHSLELFVTFENFNIYRPQIHENNGAIKLMFPQEARLRNFTYASAMTVDLNIKYVIRTGKDLENVQTFHKVMNKIHIGKLPVMLKSNICVLTQYSHVDNRQTGECKYDTGGYFIINGSEKTVLGQERAAENKVYCFNVSKNNTKYNWMAEIKSIPDFKCISPKQVNIMISSKNNGFGNYIHIQIPRIKQPLPLFIVFRALGVISDKDICEKILLDIDDEVNKPLLISLQASIMESNKYLTQEESIKYITSYAMFTPINMDKETGQRKKMEFTMDILNNDLFPHCHNVQEKVYFMGYMTKKILLTSFKILNVDDRDSYANKRIDLTGSLLNNLFRNYFNKLVKDMEKQVIREINTGSWKSKDNYENIINLTNIYKIIKSTTIENGIKRALATGDFGIKNTNSNKVGVAQVLNRLTYVSALSHARRVSTPTDKSGKLIPPRKLHNTSWGFLCLTGDTEVLLSNRHDTKRIKDIRDGDWVNTVNRTTLMDEPSEMYNFFCKMPDKLYEIETISGRKVKATADHPFLVKNEGKYVMKKISQLNLSDRLVIRHTVQHIPNEHTTIVSITTDSIIENISTNILWYYLWDLQDKSLMDVNIPTYKLKIIARLLGALSKNGLVYFKENTNTYFDCVFNVKDLCDAHQIVDDIKILGFGDLTITKMDNAYQVEKSGSFAYFLYLMGGIMENTIRTVPEWLVNAELSIKREFLSAFQGVLESDCTNLPTAMISSVTFMKQLVVMFEELGIKSFVNDPSEHVLLFEPSRENMIRYYDYINYTYGEEKRRKSTIFIEELKIMGHKAFTSAIHTIFTEDNLDYNGCVTVPILSIKEIKPEMVYDFTTRSENHSFVASSFVCSNCPAETPEGQSVGIVKNLSYMTHITIYSNSLPLYEYIMPNIVLLENTTFTSKELHNYVKVFINGAWVGVSENPEELFTILKEKKHTGIINIYTSIIFDYRMKEIRVCNDSGRMCRPLLRIKNKNILINKTIIESIKNSELVWDDLLTNCRLAESVIEYIDPEEQNWSLISIKPSDLCKEGIHKFTHCEIHPSTMFGILGSCIPFPEHNQSPRNCYQCAQGKQAMGVYVTNYENRMDKTAYVLNYPTRPLVDTRIMNMIELNKIPSGTNVIVAIMTHTGYNQEDSLLFNKGSIDRGLFVTTVYHTEKDEDKQKINGDEEIRCRPDASKTKGMKMANYGKVNSKGVIPENTIIENRDIIISKVTPIKENRNDPTKIIKYEDQSKMYRTAEESYVDKNYIDKNGEGYNFAKIRIRSVRKPVIGDKFSSRHGQKGTIGNIIPECDMPFNSDGVKPDIIINPHAIPSRMTIGQLKETVLGKVLVELGLFGDGTSFGHFDIKDICNELINLGYESHGNEMLYNGLTGEQVSCSVFMGPVFYQRLKHMVIDKTHSRSIGPMVNLTRQPAEGRSRDGGLRFGEMERDCMISHGASRFTKERMYDVSDKYEVYVCKKCGMIASYNNEMNIHHCKICDNRVDFSHVEIPYACKLLFQELNTMNITPRIIT